MLKSIQFPVLPISIQKTVFDDPLAIAILIDVFTERGFTAVVDIRRMEVPSRIDLGYEIINRVKKVYRVRINFAGSKIRGADNPK